METKVAVVRFPGTNCDRDVWEAVESVGGKARWWWHENHYSLDVDAIVIPGGFSYGDYLRAGALASRSPVMASVREAAVKGIPILGICNGFQILCESGLLPGVLIKNKGLKFIDRWVQLNPVQNSKFKFKAAQLRLPIAHGMGRFMTESPADIDRLFSNGQVWAQYAENPNGATRDIAGISDEAGKVLALMPHPERAMAEWMGGVGGREIFELVISGC